MDTSRTVQQLAKIIRYYGEDYAERKTALLLVLKNNNLGASALLQQLHESLRYLRAYPDNAELLDLVNNMLANFSHRKDLIRFREDLLSSGIAGTSIDYNFFSPMARWLTKKWPEHFSIDWEYTENTDRLMELMPLLVSFPEMAQFEDFDLSVKQWISRLSGPDETDAVFLKNRLDRINPQNIYARESLHDRLDLAFRLEPGTDTPSTTNLYYQKGPIKYQTAPLQRQRPSLRRVMRDQTFTLRYMSKKAGEILTDLAKATMLTSQRDLDAFSYGDKHDVRLINAGDGLQIICIGTRPQHRYLLPVIYGFINLKNGVPVGYFQVSISYDVADIAFTTFSTFRGAEAATILAKNLAVAHKMFAINTFTFDPYQLGHGNQDGLSSGVWWFYYKMGFRPRDAYIKDMVRKELKKMEKNKSYRSNPEILEELSSESIYFEVKPDKAHKDILERLTKLSPGISIYLAKHYGCNREKGLQECVRQANTQLGVHKNHKFTWDEIHMWQSWAPLILQLPGINKWSTKNKHDLVAVIRAKGGRRESDFLHLFQKHKTLQRAILKFTDIVEI